MRRPRIVAGVAGNQRSIGSHVPGTRDSRRHPAAVAIVVDTGRSRSSGSGIAIDEHHILTAAHVVEDAGGRVFPYYSQKGRPSHWAAVELRDDENDVAILRTEHRLENYVPLAEESPIQVKAESHGWFSGRRQALIEQQERTAIFGAPSRNGDSGGGIIAQYRGPVVTVGVISGTDGRRTFGAPFRAIKKLMSKCRCRERRSEPPVVQPPNDEVAPMPPAELTATAESAAPDTPARVKWIPAERRLHFQIPRGNPGPMGPVGNQGPQGPMGPGGLQGPAADTAALRREVEELRRRLDNFTVTVPIDVRPEKR